MLPNILLHELCGKFILVLCDLLVGVFILKLQEKQSDVMRLIQVSVWLFNPFILSLIHI